jgi:N-ethylmaleimide reductase
MTTPLAAAEWVAKETVHMVAFGRPFIANPDLPERIRAGGPYNEMHSVGWYGGSEEGYTDYPSLKST